MTQELWSAVDYYISALLAPHDAILTDTLEASAKAGLPSIQVSPTQGKLLHILARMVGARNILEIGTLGGYSSIWMARALPPGGYLLTLEADKKHAQVARENFDRAGLGTVIALRFGPALETLPKIAAEGRERFDFVFIDANKLSHRGSVIVADNVIRDGAVIDTDSKDPDILGVRRFNARLASEPSVSATEIQTVGSKGYDGFAIALVTGDPK
jgi:predicted O-methyltransferase YrrM